MRAQALAYIGLSDSERLIKELKEISRMIQGLSRSLE